MYVTYPSLPEPFLAAAATRATRKPSIAVCSMCNRTIGIIAVAANAPAVAGEAPLPDA